MEHTGLPHDHGEEQNHTAAMRELLRDEDADEHLFLLLCHGSALLSQ